MSDHVLETVRATVQDFLAPELRTHGVRLENIERRLEDTKHSLEQRIEDSKSSLQHQINDTKGSLQHEINDTKETLRAEMRALQSRFEILEVRFVSLEDLIRMSMRQIESDGALRERVACWKRGCRSSRGSVRFAYDMDVACVVAFEVWVRLVDAFFCPQRTTDHQVCGVFPSHV